MTNTGTTILFADDVQWVFDLKDTICINIIINNNKLVRNNKKNQMIKQTLQHR